MSLFVDIEKNYPGFRLKVNFEAGNEVMALLGASGCGKSLTLKCIAGIERPDRGKIILEGRTLFDSEKKICLPPQKRRVGYLFQQYALFPNMTVRQNIMCGIRKDTAGGKNTEETVQDIIKKTHLEGLEKLYPRQLSGGQQQRTALARILINDPDIMLLDEPFSALDSHLKFLLESELRNTIRSFGKTVLLVSHDKEEVFRLADSLAVINNGRIEVSGEKHKVFEDPQTVGAAVLTGCKNISKIRHLSERCILAEDWGVELETEKSSLEAAFVGIRMNEAEGLPVCASGEGSATGNNIFEVSVSELVEDPFDITIMARAAGGKKAIGWQTEKSSLSLIQDGRLLFRLPADKLLLLKE